MGGAFRAMERTKGKMMWTYTCTGCGAQVSHEEDVEAVKLFHEHVAAKHPKAHTVLVTKVSA